jgi:hypothetical protein
MKTYKVNHDNIFDLDGDGDGVPVVRGGAGAWKGPGGEAFCKKSN